MFAAIILDRFVFHIDSRLGRLNHQCADTLTCMGDVSGVITNHDNRGYRVNASVCRSRGTCIGLTVGLHTYIVVLYSIISGDLIASLVAVAILFVSNKQIAFHAILRHIEELKMTVVVDVAVVIDKVNIQRFGNYDKRTGNGIRVIHLITPVGDHSYFHISANIQLGGICLQGNFAVDIDTQEDLRNLCSSFFQCAASSYSSCVCFCIKQAVGQQCVCDDIVIIILIPCDICFNAVGINDQHSSSNCGFVIRIGSNSANQVHTYIGGQLSTNDDLDICSFCREALEHLQKNTEVFFVLSACKQIVHRGNNSLKLAQLHRRTVCKTNFSTKFIADQIIDHNQHILEFFGQEKLHITEDAFYTAVDVNIRHI